MASMRLALALIVAAAIVGAAAMAVDHLNELSPDADVEQEDQEEEVRFQETETDMEMDAATEAETWVRGADISSFASADAFKCLKKDGYQYFVVRAFRSSGTVDPNAAQTLKNAAAAGFTKENLGVYIFPRPLGPGGSVMDGGAEMSQMLDFLVHEGAGSLFTSVWLDVEGIYKYWSRDLKVNQKFFEQMMTAVKTKYKQYSVGVYTSSSQWTPIMSRTYDGGSHLPLWYAFYDNRAEHTGFKPFGGWLVPRLKQFSENKKLCGITFDENVFQGAGTLLSHM